MGRRREERMRLEPQEREPRHHGIEIGNVNYHSLNLSEIDQRALDGSFWLIVSGQNFVVARFDWLCDTRN